MAGGYKHGSYPFDAMQKVANEKVGLREEGEVVPIMVKVFDRSLKQLQRQLACCASQSHVLKEPEAAKFLETAVEQVEEARRELCK